MSESFSVSSVLQRAADRGGFSRTKYVEKDFPLDMSDITVMVFFGDLRSTFIMSSILLKRYREEMKGSKYFILITWPGYECLFPYVNEYWTIRDKGILRKFQSESNGFYNTSQYTTLYRRNLNHFFEDVVDFAVIEPYYKNGIVQDFWDRFKHVTVTMPSVPSSAILDIRFNKQLAQRQGYKVFIYPSLYVQSWSQGRLTQEKSSKEFWVALAKKMSQEGFIPVVYKNFFTHDISSELTNECIYFEEDDVFKLLGAIRTVGCVLDVFSSFSRLAIAARTPFVACDERLRYSNLKEYEIDGLCCSEDLPREYIYSFSSLAKDGNLDLWNASIFANIITKLNKFLPDMDREAWPLPSPGTEIVPYDKVRKTKLRKFAPRFIKIERD